MEISDPGENVNRAKHENRTVTLVGRSRVTANVEQIRKNGRRRRGWSHCSTESRHLSR